MKNQNEGFIVPILLGIIALLVIGGGVYMYENKKADVPIAPVNMDVQATNQVQQTDTQNPPVITANNSTQPTNPTASCNSVQNGEITVLPLTVTSPTTHVMAKSNLANVAWNNVHCDPNTKVIVVLGESNGTGLWNITTQKTGVPVSQGYASVSLPSSITDGSYRLFLYTATDLVNLNNDHEIGAFGGLTFASGASSNGPFIVDVRSQSNAVDVDAFHSGDMVTITGSNFPTGCSLACDDPSTVVWIGSTKVTYATGHITGQLFADSQSINFIAPQLSPGTYTLYVTGCYPAQTSGVTCAQSQVQSNSVQVQVTVQ